MTVYRSSVCHVLITMDGKGWIPPPVHQHFLLCVMDEFVMTDVCAVLLLQDRCSHDTMHCCTYPGLLHSGAHAHTQGFFTLLQMK